LAPRPTLSATVVDDTVAAAAILLDKWHPEDSSSGRSLFLDSSPEEADRFLRASKDLHRAMLFHASSLTTKDLHGGGHGLIQAQELLHTAMRRLELELYTLLASLPNVLYFQQDDEDQSTDGLSETCGHLRAVTEAMLAAGYGKECVSVFKERRRASVAAELQRLHGFSPSLQQATIQKLAWEQIDDRMQSWLPGARAAFSSVFAGERELCDRVFAGDSASVGDAVFSDISPTIRQRASSPLLRPPSGGRGAPRSGCSACSMSTTRSPRPSSRPLSRHSGTSRRSRPVPSR
jgi:hypothetical protein